jgi:transglutaminase-like putative cysteine protease
MIRLELQVDLNYQIDGYGADFLFNVHAAHTPSQVIAGERLTLSQAIEAPLYTDPATGNRCMRLHAFPGELQLSYTATVDLTHHFADPATILEVPVSALPPEVIGYIFPSRYCQSDRLLRLAAKEFGGLRQNYGRVQAIRDWVHQHVAFTSNSTNANTSAVDTLVERVGVCRDFAHLMIALCRAVNVPARFATGTDYGSDPALGPPDFHAYVEVYLGDRWYIFDPSGLAIPMGLVRFATGRDAADVAFATIFGNVLSRAPFIRAVAVEDAEGGLVLPFHCGQALSTDSPGNAAVHTFGAGK